jgi:predicted  nucleic acid-binding Zn-ribbon protein
MEELKTEKLEIETQMEELKKQKLELEKNNDLMRKQNKQNTNKLKKAYDLLTKY